MDLAAKAAARLKNKLVMRCGVVLIILGLLGNSIMVPKAKAFALSAGMVYGLVGAFITAVGLTPVITGAVNTDDVGDAIGQLLNEYLTAEVGGQSVLEWGADVAKVTVDSTAHLGLPRVLADKLAQFAAWVAAKYIAKPGEGAVIPGQYIRSIAAGPRSSWLMGLRLFLLSGVVRKILSRLRSVLFVTLVKGLLLHLVIILKLILIAD